jgi:hypothetical protein
MVSIARACCGCGSQASLLRLTLRGIAWQAEDSCGSVHLLEDFHVHWYDDRVHVTVSDSPQ